MKRSVFLSLSALVFLGATGTVFGQQSCEFNIIGTWKAPATYARDAALYRFAPDGRVTELSLSSSGPASEPREVAQAVYKLDNPKAPKSIAFTAAGTAPGKGGGFAYGTSSMEILKYDDASFTCVTRGSEPARWVRVDPNRYFIVLAARNGEFYNTSGSAFPILIKKAGAEPQVDAVGTYSDRGKEAFGRVPLKGYEDFIREPRKDSEVMLRLEINTAQYERGLKILRTWERRAREGALLYETNYALNNILLVKAVTETLNQCSEEVELYKLSYIHPQDWITNEYAPSFVPFYYFKELRRLNESLHVRDDKFQEAVVPAGSRPVH